MAARKKKNKLPAWTDAPLALAVRALVEAINTIGLDDASPALSALGASFARLPSNRARVHRCIENLGYCFPEMSEAQRRELVIESYRHLFSLAAEVAIAPRVVTKENWPEHISFRDYEPIYDFLKSGEPLIFVTGHYGNWEILGQAIYILGFTVHALYRPLDNKALDKWMREVRAGCGIQMIDKFGATKQLPALMEQRKPVAFVADQNAGDNGLFVPFFDRLASAYKSIGVLAMRYRANIAVGAAHRIGPNLQYRLEPMDHFTADDYMHQPDPLFYITARYRYALERGVSKAPEQYLWMHRYWKSRPRHERAGKPFPPRLREKIEQLPWMTPERVGRIVERSALDTERYAEDYPKRAAAARARLAARAGEPTPAQA